MNLVDIPAPVFRKMPREFGPKVDIGGAWTPGWKVVHDDVRGLHWEVNPPMSGDSERRLQAALIQDRIVPTRPSVWRRFLRLIGVAS